MYGGGGRLPHWKCVQKIQFKRPCLTLPLPPAPNQTDGDLILGDMGHGLPLRAGTFDGAISISAVQWLCNADRASHDPRRRMKAFFECLYRCLARGARAVLQIYPEGSAQAELLVSAAMKARQWRVCVLGGG